MNATDCQEFSLQPVAFIRPTISTVIDDPHMQINQEKSLRVILPLIAFLSLTVFAFLLVPEAASLNTIQTVILGILIILNAYYFFTKATSRAAKQTTSLLLTLFMFHALTKVMGSWMGNIVDIRLTQIIVLSVIVTFNIIHLVSALRKPTPQ